MAEFDQAREQRPAITRRQLLLAVGAAGGAGALLGALSAMQLVDEDEPALFTPPSRSDFTLRGGVNRTSVLVLGAGVAGLCCAYELGKAGYDVTVIDARRRAGGRCWTVRGGDELVDTRGATQRCEFADGRWFNPGPARIAQHHTTMSYCRELGVPVEVFVNVNTDAYVSTRGTVRRRRSVQADLDGYLSELLAKAIARDALDAEVPLSERELLVDHLRSIGALGRADRGFETVPGVGGEVGGVGDPDDLATLLRLGFGQRLAFEREFDQAAPMFHPVGGMDAIPRALAAAAGATMRLGYEVLQIRNTAGGVEVTATDPNGRLSSFRGDVGVCALPPKVAAGLDSNWDREVVRALDEPEPVTTGKLGLEYDRRFWESDDRIFGGITHCDPSVRDIWYPSTGYFGDGGVLVGAYPFGLEADRFSRLPHADRVAMAVLVGESIHGPAYRDELRSSFSVDWKTQPYTRAAWCGWRRFGVSYHRLLRGHGRWWFAGDWLARIPGWQHGALESARRAVSDLHQRVLKAELDGT